jgi:hypothetical protein
VQGSAFLTHGIEVEGRAEWARGAGVSVRERSRRRGVLNGGYFGYCGRRDKTSEA